MAETNITPCWGRWKSKKASDGFSTWHFMPDNDWHDAPGDRGWPRAKAKLTACFVTRPHDERKIENAKEPPVGGRVCANCKART